MYCRSAHELEGRGVYTILVNASPIALVDVGRLGRFEFSGLYAYTGSAQGKGNSSLNGRVSRHLGLRQEKRVRWHIDYLLAHPFVKMEGAAISMTITKSKECQVSKNIFDLAESLPPARGFGSSDCSCESHLAKLTGGTAPALSIILRAHIRAGLEPELVCSAGLSGNAIIYEGQ